MLKLAILHLLIQAAQRFPAIRFAGKEAVTAVAAIAMSPHGIVQFDFLLSPCIRVAVPLQQNSLCLPLRMQVFQQFELFDAFQRDFPSRRLNLGPVTVDRIRIRQQPNERQSVKFFGSSRSFAEPALLTTFGVV